MRKPTSGVAEFFAVALALATVIAAAIMIGFYGRAETLVPSPYGGQATVEVVVNWPLIVACLVSAVYSILFAALLNYVATTRNTTIAIANHLQIKLE